MSQTPEDATGPIPVIGTGPKVAFLGLGVMGAPMAGHLAAADYQITVYNRNPNKALAWVALNRGFAKPTAAEAVEGAEEDRAMGYASETVYDIIREYINVPSQDGVTA